ncbi:MAG TPA: hypothetical protein IAB23_10520 [Candidatus Scybalocola faecavium]|nr:hypothetical protein [Candidatus Scybalocola faecavium]
MNKEEILEKSRQENKNKDIYEQEIIKQGNAVVTSVMVILATVFFIIQVFTGGGINYGLYAIVFCHSMVLSWMKWVKLRQHPQLALALLYTVCILLFSICHIYNLLTL